MGKKRVLGQDPLTWIRRTDDTQPEPETDTAPAGEAPPDVEETSPANVPGTPPVVEETSHVNAPEAPPVIEEISSVGVQATPTVMTAEPSPTPEPTEKKEAMTEKTAVPQEKSQEERVVVRLADFETFAEAPSEEKLEPKKMSLLMDLTLPVTVELGRTEMVIKDILKLRQGSMIELDKLAGEPVDLVVNGRKLAEGEVVVIDEYFGIRITNLAETSEQELEELRSLGGGR